MALTISPKSQPSILPLPLLMPCQKANKINEKERKKKGVGEGKVMGQPPSPHERLIEKERKTKRRDREAERQSA